MKPRKHPRAEDAPTDRARAAAALAADAPPERADGAYRSRFARGRALALAFAAALPFLLGASEDAYEANRQRIEAMTAVERAALQQKFEAWKKLPDSDKEKLRALHRELDVDSRNGGNLHSVLAAYSAWLKTLTPAQREELRAASDPSARMRLVREFKEKQERRRSERPPSWNVFHAPGPIARFLRDLHVGPQDIEPPLALLAARLSPTERAALDGLEPRVRHVRILSLALKAAPREGEPPPDDRPENAPPARPPRWPDDTLLKSLIESIPNDDARRFLSARKDFDVARDGFRFFLMAGLAGEWQDEFRRHQPRDDELQKIVSGDANLRERLLLAGDREELRRRLTFQYLIRNPRELDGDFGEFVQVMLQLSNRPGADRAGFDRPGFGRGLERPGPRRRGEGREFPEGPRPGPRPGGPRGEGPRRGPDGERPPDRPRRPE